MSFTLSEIFVEVRDSKSNLSLTGFVATRNGVKYTSGNVGFVQLSTFAQTDFYAKKTGYLPAKGSVYATGNERTKTVIIYT